MYKGLTARSHSGGSGRVAVAGDTDATMAGGGSVEDNGAQFDIVIFITRSECIRFHRFLGLYLCKRPVGT